MNPNASHYIIGHSHGGNIALKAVALADMADIEVVCLSTPFLQAIFLGIKQLPRELSGFEIEAFFNFTLAERQLIEERQAREPWPFIKSMAWCAVQRRGLSAGANPARRLSLRLVAIGAAGEATKRLKPSV